MTYRERREAKAERLRGWAETRQADAAAVFKAGEPYTSDIAFNTQPGHIPFRARLIAREDRAYESLEKARDMESRADGIERAAEAAIYDDDPDAIEQLKARILDLEAQRSKVKARPHEGWELRNLAGNITRQRQRLARLEHEKVNGKPWRYLYSVKYPGSCCLCGRKIEKGVTAAYRDSELKCITNGKAECPKADTPSTTEVTS